MKFNCITVHCSATREGQNFTVDQLRQMHLKRGFSDIGYHYVIDVAGMVHEGRPITQTGAHVQGHNTGNIGVCLIGGLDAAGKAKFTYTPSQMSALAMLLGTLRKTHSIEASAVCGHRDWSPDLNKDGKITSNEYVKECPCFDVKPWYALTLAGDASHA